MRRTRRLLLGTTNAKDQQARANEPRSGQITLRALLHPVVMRAKHMTDFSKWDRANLEAVASDMLRRIVKDTATSEAELLSVLELRSKLQVGKSSQISGEFRFGVAVGLCAGCTLASFGWVAFFWLASLSA